MGGRKSKVLIQAFASFTVSIWDSRKVPVWDRIPGSLEFVVGHHQLIRHKFNFGALQKDATEAAPQISSCRAELRMTSPHPPHGSLEGSDWFLYLDPCLHVLYTFVCVYNHTKSWYHAYVQKIYKYTRKYNIITAKTYVLHAAPREHSTGI